MTIAKVANHSKNRGKIGAWDRAEVVELVTMFRELADAGACLITLADEGDPAAEETAELMRSALIPLAKRIAATVVAGAPEVAAELAQSFYVISGASGVRPNTPTPEVSGFKPVSVAVLSSETRRVSGSTVDVALLRLAFHDAASGAPSVVDAVLVRRNRSTDERQVEHFQSAPRSTHFDAAIQRRAEWLGISDGAAQAHPYPCT